MAKYTRVSSIAIAPKISAIADHYVQLTVFILVLESDGYALAKYRTAY